MKCYGVMCDALLSCDVLRDSYVTDGALTPAAQCLTQISAACGRREGGCSAVPTKFRGSLHNIRRRRLSNTVCRLLIPNGGGHQILLKLLRNSVATSSVVEGGVVQCVVEGGGNATQNVSH